MPKKDFDENYYSEPDDISDGSIDDLDEDIPSEPEISESSGEKDSEDEFSTDEEASDEDEEDADAEDEEEEAEIQTGTEVLDVEADSCLYNQLQSETVNNVAQKKKDTKKIIVPKDERTTRPILTKYERTRLLGEREVHLIHGAKPMIKNFGEMAHKDIAAEELKKKVLPMKIERPLPNGTFEIWTLQELK